MCVYVCLQLFTHMCIYKYIYMQITLPQLPKQEISTLHVQVSSIQKSQQNHVHPSDSSHLQIA